MSAARSPWLVADVGGTNARFGLVDAPDAPVRDVHAMRCGDFPSVEAAALAYLERLSTGGHRVQPQAAALAVATAIDGDVARMTNSPWTVSRPDIAAALQCPSVLLLNDFEALALALPSLAKSDEASVRWIGAARSVDRLPMAVLGPGTGLGVAACVPSPSGWVAVAAEGGHVTAVACDGFESDVLAAARAESPSKHVSAERLLSGIGLPWLHRAVCAVRGVALVQLTAEDITGRAIDEGDADCLATLDCFCAMLGSFAGNVALTVGARGGVFIAGGIAQKLEASLLRSRFRACFEAKGRFSDYLGRVGTGLIVAPHAALDGAAQALRQLA